MAVSPILHLDHQSRLLRDSSTHHPARLLPFPLLGYSNLSPSLRGREERLWRQAVASLQANSRQSTRSLKAKTRQDCILLRRTHSGRIMKPQDIFSPTVGLASLYDELEDRLSLSSLPLSLRLSLRSPLQLSWSSLGCYPWTGSQDKHS